MNINNVWPEWNEDCVLGEGSFGKVYRAKRVEYGRTFYSAIKVITVPKNQQEIKFARSQGMNDNDIYDYFRGLVDNLLNEITLMDNLKGAKNIVGIEDYKIIERQGEIGWDIFIRMELLSPFDSFVSNPEFSQKDVIKLGIDLCSALEVCEQNNILHRDIKPDNIFISRFGEYKLGDFGIARKLEATQANLSRKGTLNYMAPEVYKSEEYGANVDIYSLGLVLYTLLNNNRTAFLPQYPAPISYKDNEEALSKRLSGLPMLPPCNASASLSAVVLKACAYLPQDRYQTATEFKNALISEWNVLIQSGDNRGINAESLQYGANMEYAFQHTTNDMTANGRMVVDKYVQDGTTVLDGSNAAYMGTGYGNAGGNVNYDMNVNTANVQIPQEYPQKSSKACRILAWPMAIATFVMAIILLLNGRLGEEVMLGVSLLGIGSTILLSDRNKYATGICVLAGSFAYVLSGMAEIFGRIHDGFPVFAMVTMLSGALMLFGGIVIIAQKEIRFGGSLCLYAFIVEWLYYIYQLINDNFDVDMWRIAFGVAAVTVFIWSYGYKKEFTQNVFKKILFIISFVAAGLVGIYGLIFAIKSLLVIF